MDLENIAQQVMKRLKIENPKHPIFSASREQFSIWKYNNIYENQWNNSDGRQIINILFNILLEKSSFNAVVHSLKSNLFRQYLCIARQNASMYSGPLIVIFQSVARRLGIYCDLVSFLLVDPSFYSPYDVQEEITYWLLKWQLICNVIHSDDEQCLYIHLGRNAAILNINNLPIIDFCTLEYSINFDRYPRIHLLELMITLAEQYMSLIQRENMYHNYHRKRCNDLGCIFERDRWWTKFLDLVTERSIAQSLDMSEKEDVFKFVDELEKVSR